MWSLPTLAVSGPPSYVSSVEWRRGGWALAIRRLEVFLGGFLGLRQQLQFVCVHTLSCQVSRLPGRNEFSCKRWFGCEGRLLILWNNIWVIVSLSDFCQLFLSHPLLLSPCSPEGRRETFVSLSSKNLAGKDLLWDLRCSWVWNLKFKGNHESLCLRKALLKYNFHSV